MDSEFFRAIPREELASVAWTGAEKYNRAPVIVATTQHFNQVTLWVSEEIVTSKDLKRRFQLLCHFIGVAKASLDLSNYNGVRSITAGLQSAPVHRLERTWAMVGRREKAAFDKMCDLMSPLRNSDAYRRRLIDTKPPCVPYLGTLIFSVGQTAMT
ncbi:ras guanine nucleotide exchange factor domain-containing protein [Phlyctochytrium arcticum]|nr:ras guanine nucleotide exchange factor domain-containing protein [Phlyctochytrium arcticum]